MIIYRKKEGLLTRKIANENIIVETDNGFCHVMNNVGSIVWDNLDDKCIEDIIKAVENVVEVPAEGKGIIESDTKEYVGLLLEKGLIIQQEI